MNWLVIAAATVGALVAFLNWNSILWLVLVADWVLRSASGTAVEPEAKLTVIVVVAKETVDDAWRLPLIWKEPEIVEEALEM